MYYAVLIVDPLVRDDLVPEHLRPAAVVVLSSEEHYLRVVRVRGHRKIAPENAVLRIQSNFNGICGSGLE